MITPVDALDVVKPSDRLADTVLQIHEEQSFASRLRESKFGSTVVDDIGSGIAADVLHDIKDDGTTVESDTDDELKRGFVDNAQRLVGYVSNGMRRRNDHGFGDDAHIRTDMVETCDTLPSYDAWTSKSRPSTHSVTSMRKSDWTPAWKEKTIRTTRIGGAKKITSRHSVRRGKNARAIRSLQHPVSSGSKQVLSSTASNIGRFIRTATETVRRIAVAMVSALSATVGLPALLLMIGCIGVLAIMSLLSWLPSMNATVEGCRTGAESGKVCSSINGLAGTLQPRLVMNPDNSAVDIAATEVPSATTYEQWQCTWWAASRRQHIGRAVDGHMGDGWMWKDSATRHGYLVSKDAKPGDVMVFQKGVLGADATYGHVSIVEEVNADGSIIISESSAAWREVRLRTITRLQLTAHMDDIDFIH